MAKTKGSNPPVRELMYKDADGILYYLGEFFRGIFSEGFISPRDPEIDITGRSNRGRRPTQEGPGSAQQKIYRESFHNCSVLWNSLPEECPDPVPDPPPTSKKSVWDAKLEHGVVCSYYDLFMKCCMEFAKTHGGAMPDGDCFPCEAECVPDPDIEWDKTVSAKTIARDSAVTVAITGEGISKPFSWSVSGTGFSMLNSETTGVTNTLIADDTACGTAKITVTGCDDTVTTGCVRCTEGYWNLISNCSQNGGDKSEATNLSRILLTGGDCETHTRKEEFWGECCDPSICGTATHCCGYFWNGYCPYCAGYGGPLTSVKGVGEWSDWECV